MDAPDSAPALWGVFVCAVPLHDTELKLLMLRLLPFELHKVGEQTRLLLDDYSFIEQLP